MPRLAPPIGQANVLQVSDPAFSLPRAIRRRQPVEDEPNQRLETGDPPRANAGYLAAG
jgi:hypothetical protein